MSIRVMAFDLNTTRCGACFNEDGKYTRFRADIGESRKIDKFIAVHDWCCNLIEDYTPEVVCIETYSEFGPTQSLMAALIAPIEQSVVRLGITLLRVPANDLKYFIIPNQKKVSKTDRLNKAKTYSEFVNSPGPSRPSHDEADAFFLSLAGTMLLEWLQKGHREISWPMHQRYIMFSHKTVTHGLRGLAHNPGRYLYLGRNHELPKKGTVTAP